MKISDIIGNIIRVAEDKFGVSTHNNDTITVNLYCTPYGTWQVSLIRPTLKQLDRGEVATEQAYTIKISEDLHSFFTERDTLLGALRALQRNVQDACDWDDGHSFDDWE